MTFLYRLKMKRYTQYLSQFSNKIYDICYQSSIKCSSAMYLRTTLKEEGLCVEAAQQQQVPG